MCGRCTRSASGTSSQLATASGNSTKTSLAEVDDSTPNSVLQGRCRCHQQQQQNNCFCTQDITLVFDPYQAPPCRQGGRDNNPQLAWTFCFFFLSFFLQLWDSFFDSVLPFTPHNPESLHNFLGVGESFLTLGCVRYGTYVCHIMHQNSSFRIFENVELET